MDQRAVVADLFGVRADEVVLGDQELRIGPRRYDVIDDIIILLEPGQLSADTRARIASARRGQGSGVAALAQAKGPSEATGSAAEPSSTADFAADIQRSFGREWDAYREILPEHDMELLRYFDVVDLNALGDKRLLDLGCGMGRWSVLLADRAREVVLVDYSDAIFVARENLRNRENCVFFLGDITRLPFRDGCSDLAYSLGVMQTLPMPCLDVVRQLGRLTRELVIYAPYALDNRPAHWKAILAGVSAVRLGLSRLRNEPLRRGIARAGAIGLYQPLIALGNVLDRVGGPKRRWGNSIPLWDAYHGMSTRRIEQDVYDRFFTRIDQRVTRAEIRELADTFNEVVISEGLPYWHFVCRGHRHNR